MPFVALDIPPGVYRNGTRRQAAGRWYEADLVRWYGGSMQPVGGWDPIAFTSPDVVIPTEGTETFADDDIGIPSNWTSVKDNGIDDPVFAIEASASAKFGQWLKVLGTNGLFWTGWVYWNDQAQFADGEALALLRHTSGTQSDPEHVGVTARFSPNGASSDGVSAILDFVANQVQLRSWNAGAAATMAATAFTLAEDTDYWVRFAFDGRDYKVRVWEDGDSEPGTWTLEHTATVDVEPTTAGYLAVEVDHFESNAGPSEADNDILYVHGIGFVDSGGETAPAPDAESSAPSLGETISTLFAWRDNNNVPWLAIGTPTKLYLFSEGILSEIALTGGFTPGTEDASSQIAGYGTGAYGAGIYNEGVTQSVGTVLESQSWQFDNFGEFLVAVAHSDGKIFRFQPNVSTAAAVVANAPTDNLGVVVTPERFLVALGAGGDPRAVQWADQESLTTWTPTTENQAGDFPLSGEGTILTGHRGRGETLIWTTQDLFSMQYIGGTLVYAFNQVGSNCGMIGRQAFGMVDSSRALWMGQNAFFIYDGSTRPVPCDVSDYVFSDLNRTQASKIHTVVWPEFNEMWWFYCSAASDDVDRYVSFNYLENHWTIGNLARTAGVPRGVFANPILADRLGVLYYHENGTEYLDIDGVTALVPLAESGPYTIAEGDHTMWIREIIPDEKTLGDVRAYLKTRLYPTAAEQSFGPFTLANPTSTRASGRQVALRVEQVSPSWRVGIPRLDIVPAGRR